LVSLASIERGEVFPPPLPAPLLPPLLRLRKPHAPDQKVLGVIVLISLL